MFCVMLWLVQHCVSMLEDLPHVVWLWSWRPDRCSRCSSCLFRSHSFLHSVWPADIEGRRRRWWPSAPHAGSQSSCEGCSCTAWRRRTDGSDQLCRERKRENRFFVLFGLFFPHLHLLSWQLYFICFKTQKDISSSSTSYWQSYYCVTWNETINKKTNVFFM